MTGPNYAQDGLDRATKKRQRYDDRRRVHIVILSLLWFSSAVAFIFAPTHSVFAVLAVVLLLASLSRSFAPPVSSQDLKDANAQYDQAKEDLDRAKTNIAKEGL